MVNRKIMPKILVISLALWICGCGAPFKKLPGYDETQDQIQTVALYPMSYSDDGQEQRMFGMVFSESFYGSVQNMPMTRPLQFIEPDSTVSLMEANGRIVSGERADIIVGSTFPIYKMLAPSDLQAISNEAQVLVFCDLLSYNEVGSGEELTQAITTGLATACLTGGMFMSACSEQNVVSMKITLFETATGQPLWEYEPYLTASLTGEQRDNFTEKIIAGFRKYFPLSVDFKNK